MTARGVGVEILRPDAAPGYRWRIRRPTVRPWTTIENTTTTYVAVSTASRPSNGGSFIASATDTPPLSPPQVNTLTVPRSISRRSRSRLTGIDTPTNRASNTAGTTAAAA